MYLLLEYFFRKAPKVSNYAVSKFFDRNIKKWHDFYFGAKMVFKFSQIGFFNTLARDGHELKTSFDLLQDLLNLVNFQVT